MQNLHYNLYEISEILQTEGPDMEEFDEDDLSDSDHNVQSEA